MTALSATNHSQSLSFQTLDDLPSDMKGTKVLLRVDINVPVNDHGEVTDNTRIDRIKPTVDDLRQRGARIIMAAHYGRPKGKKDSAYSLQFLSDHLSTLWGFDVTFSEETIGQNAQLTSDALKDGDVLLLENTRFSAEETENGASFAKELAALADIFVHDAFSVAHRAHASSCAVADYLPSYAGRLMEAELNALAAALETPQKPVAAIVGGAKISTKLDLLNSLIEKMDVIILGGGMANTFLYAKGYDLKSSLCEKDMKETAASIITRAKELGCDIVLPIDVTCATEFKANAESNLYTVDAIGDDMMALDIGPESFALIKDKLASCKTVLWNGPLGAFEIEPFDTYTSALAQYVQKRTLEDGLVSVAGGGDTVAALSHAGIKDKDFTYLSTAGGAFLEWLEGKTLPGVQALINAKNI